ncbi:hypothetical protein BJF79_23830 [Actinomadura sp. CNU-125]|uniref:hypothetical protein n=1 Tax=Actinomadura sp. CNU-125 TaxID=1904961 RepID=UPI00095A8281|nr:hypothetical protein [Actinomadura sp. CNU-125]OLT11595.1 hypothetical protein BJF79_23830 [Actinomadura sp. CNU-125]
MPDSSFGRPGRSTGRPAARSWERSFRCPSTAVRRRAEAPARRYEEFVALHSEYSSEPDLPLRQLWWTGLSCAVGGSVLTFAAVLGLRGMFGLDVPVFAGTDVAVEGAATSYALCVLAGTVQGTALMHLLLAGAARPVRAFAFIGGLAVAIMAVLPLLLNGPVAARLVTAGINLAGGAAVVVLLCAVVSASMPRPSWPGGPR